MYHVSVGAVHKGRQQRGEGVRPSADIFFTDGRGVKILTDVRKLELFKLYQHALQTFPMGEAYSQGR